MQKSLETFHILNALPRLAVFPVRLREVLLLPTFVFRFAPTRGAFLDAVLLAVFSRDVDFFINESFFPCLPRLGFVPDDLTFDFGFPRYREDLFFADTCCLPLNFGFFSDLAAGRLSLVRVIFFPPPTTRFSVFSGFPASFSNPRRSLSCLSSSFCCSSLLSLSSTSSSEPKSHIKGVSSSVPIGFTSDSAIFIKTRKKSRSFKRMCAALHQ